MKKEAGYSIRTTNCYEKLIANTSRFPDFMHKQHQYLQYPILWVVFNIIVVVN